MSVQGDLAKSLYIVFVDFKGVSLEEYRARRSMLLPYPKNNSIKATFRLAKEFKVQHGQKSIRNGNLRIIIVQER